ncbi:isochorismatase family protein [Nocardia sp. BMG51109]|uniref:isochorismatase family protein n=1 Tax=Nocardia sp. BMG51109 TaxID=1056816 RepID=UPI0004648DBE|nr:isochorismatase family protein [Nocardia sp. BMG51109]
MSKKVGSPDLSTEQAALRDAYTAAGFGHSLDHGEHPAVLVVDFSNGFTDPSVPTGTDLSAEVETTAGVVAVARAVRAPIVYTTIGYDSPDQAAVWLRKAPGLAELTVGSRLVDIDDRLDVHADDTVVVKHHASAFFGTGLAERLRAAGVDSIVLCGATTSGCVRATAVDAVSSGFPVLIPRDCVGDRAAGPHAAALFDLQAKYADVVTADAAVARLRATARREALA